MIGELREPVTPTEGTGKMGWTVGQEVIVRRLRHRGNVDTTGVVVKIARKYVTVKQEGWPSEAQYEIESGYEKASDNSNYRARILTPEIDALETRHADALVSLKVLGWQPVGYGKTSTPLETLEAMIDLLARVSSC